MDEIIEIYGSPVPRFEAIEWPKLRSFVGTPGPNYWVFDGYFENAKVASVINGVELIDSGDAEKTYQELSTDMWDSVLRCYVHSTPETVFPCKDFSSFYQNVFASPEKYICPQLDLREVL